MRVYLLVGILFFHLSVFGQESANNKSIRVKEKKSVYVSVLAGYGFGIGTGQNFQTQQTSSKSVVSAKAHSFGKGFNLSFVTGIMITQNIGTELNLGYHFGGSNKKQHIWINDTASAQRVEENYEFRANYGIINPNLVIAPGNSKTVVPYVKLGPSFLFGKTKTLYEAKVRFLNGAKGTENAEWEYTGGFGLGFSTAGGIKFKTPNDKVFFVIEASYNSLSFGVKKGKMISDTYQNMYRNRPLTTSEKEVVFVDEIDEKAAQNPNKPMQKLKYKANADNITLSLGWYFIL
ncbi:MAG: hypothetical protein J7604_09010 [Sporocytophaga sp.]|uniref:hypothetical protein n=1 Tax=Sporocytophaga sp. TaxID=2231183 RepID=UPI001B19080A|nr:hypothetical protein [Sporocytophaga sp.]MBO9700334.1 hypothetical protein [Sporocytophaga sp.]